MGAAADLRYADVEDAAGADFTGADLSNARISCSGSIVSLRGAVMSCTSIKPAIGTEGLIAIADLREVVVDPMCSLRLSHVDLSGVDAPGLDWSHIVFDDWTEPFSICPDGQPPAVNERINSFDKLCLRG